ncbi:MAG: hypothetical protein IBX61_07970 [Thermoleophilia bacterium]|nr:hypothetical protein [Thermoleophilia bacterium]
MTINDYSFGRIVIDGKTYASDVIVFPERIMNWWRQTGHSVAAVDLEEIMPDRPEVLIVGTGAYGAVDIPPETRDYVATRKIEMIALPTAEACDRYNQLKERRRVVAALHLTC